MSLIITAQNEAKLTIKDTSIELPSIFVRLTVSMPGEKPNMLVDLLCFQNKEAQKGNIGPIFISEIKLDSCECAYPKDNSSELLAAHEAIVDIYTELGYDVEIVDLP